MSAPGGEFICANLKCVLPRSDVRGNVGHPAVGKRLPSSTWQVTAFLDWLRGIVEEDDMEDSCHFGIGRCPMICPSRLFR